MIRELLEATPEPPEAAEIDALIYTFDTMRDARQKILDSMVGPIVISEEDRALAPTLAARDAAWMELLQRAKTAVGNSRVGTQKLRRYGAYDTRDL